jgi:hypothetical protein
MLECARVAVAGTLPYFVTETLELDPLMEGEMVQGPGRGVMTGEQAREERVHLAREAVAALARLGVDVRHPIANRFNCAFTDPPMRR